MSSTRVRDAELRDLAAIAILERDSFEPAWSAPDLAPWLDSRRGLMLVAEDDSAIVGYILFQLLPGEAELLRLAVTPDRRRHGVGKALVSCGLERLADEGRGSCFLEVRDGNRAAVSLYGGFGFRLAGRRSSYYADGGDALLYRRDRPSGVG